MKKITIKSVSLFLSVFLSVVCLCPFSYAAEATSVTSTVGSSSSQPVTLEALLQSLYQMDGSPLMLENPDTADIEEAKWGNDIFAWADAYNITEQIDFQNLSPEDLVNREQLAVILYNYAEHNDVNLSVSKTAGNLDDVCDYAVDAVNWAVTTGVIDSSLNGGFHPHDNVSYHELTSTLSNYDEANFERVGVVANGMTLIYPSEDQYTICPLRDFYVAGDIDNSISVPDCKV